MLVPHDSHKQKSHCLNGIKSAHRKMPQSCSAGIFFGHVNVFLVKEPCSNSKREEEMGESKEVGKRERGAA